MGTRTGEARRLRVTGKRDTTKAKAAFPPLFEVRTGRMDAHDRCFRASGLHESRRFDDGMQGPIPS